MENNHQKIIDKLHKYHKYLNLSPSQRKDIVSSAKQNKKPTPNPQGEHVFPKINFVNFHVLDEDGLVVKLTTYRYPAKGKPKAVILMFHGLNSHIGHGAHLAHYFSEHGYQTVGFDHRGFGQSQGQPGYVKNLQYHLDDCLRFVHMMRHMYPEMKFFCLGLSMGGLASYYLTLTHRHLFEGAVLMAPALKNQIGSFLVSVSGILKSILPQHTKLTGPVYGKASRNPTITDFVKQDPYAYKGRVNLATAAFLTKTMDKSPETFINYKCPFLIIQGGCDKLVNPMVAFEMFTQSPLSQEDKDILFYQHMWHDIWHEDEIYQINQHIVKWLDKRLQKAQENLAKGEKKEQIPMEDQSRIFYK